ncbi:MAG: CoB--CoM heterodisulfide reductase iron-sulfur subunit A family protein [Nitrospinae bacterium]|nr:CoB--CoM heterodisulfide reductase iron-sulfur subunit A family protein [Nitrospinota bacterium]
MRDLNLEAYSKPRNVVVIGGGVSGITTAVEAAQSGAEVLLVESGHLLGGRLLMMHKYFPKLDSPTIGLGVHLRRIKNNPKITELTNSEAVSVSGSKGHFTVEIQVRPNFVNQNCDGCNKCAEVCPVEVEDKFNYSMQKTKAIFALPSESKQYVIDVGMCDGAKCGKCAEVCHVKAIDLQQQATTISVKAESVVVATGWEPYDATLIKNLGFGRVPDVISNVMMERLVAPDGPTGGKILRPSDSSEPKHIAFVQCAGSRDEEHLPYCSAICCMVSLKQAMYIRDAHPNSKISIIYTELTNPCPGRYDKFLAKVIDDGGIKYIKGSVDLISCLEGSCGANLTIKEHSGEILNLDADMVVLATGVVPSILSNVLKDVMVLDKNGFLNPEVQKDGIYVTGMAKMPFDVTSSMLDAAGTAIRTTQRIRQ